MKRVRFQEPVAGSWPALTALGVAALTLATPAFALADDVDPPTATFGSWDFFDDYECLLTSKSGSHNRAFHNGGAKGGLVFFAFDESLANRYERGSRITVTLNGRNFAAQSLEIFDETLADDPVSTAIQAEFGAYTLPFGQPISYAVSVNGAAVMTGSAILPKDAEPSWTACLAAPRGDGS